MGFTRMIRNFLAGYDGFAGKRIYEGYFDERGGDVCVRAGEVKEKRYTDGCRLVTRRFFIEYAVLRGMGDNAEQCIEEDAQGLCDWLDSGDSLPVYEGFALQDIRADGYEVSEKGAQSRVCVSGCAVYLKGRSVVYGDS